MRDDNFSKLDKIAKKREVMLDDVIKSITDIEVINKENANKMQKYKVDEIKYKTTIKELNEYINVYKKRLEEFENKDTEKEIVSLRKQILMQQTDISTLKTILDSFVRKYGIDHIVDITKIDKKKIESYLGD